MNNKGGLNLVRSLANKKAKEDYLTNIREGGRNAWGKFYKYMRSDRNVAPPLKGLGNTQELD